MAKPKTKKEKPALSLDATATPAPGMPERLSEVRFSYPDESNPDTPVESGVDREMEVVLEGVHAVDTLLAGYVEGLDASEGVLVYSFYKAVEGIGKAGQAAVRDRLVELGQAGEVETEYGKLSVSKVSSTIVRHYTEETTKLFEEKGILTSAVEMQAQMKQGINVETITDEEMVTLQKFFDINLTLNPDKVNGLVALGKIKAEEVDATLQEETVRSGSVRLTVKPSTDIVHRFGMEK